MFFIVTKKILKFLKTVIFYIFWEVVIFSLAYLVYLAINSVGAGDKYFDDNGGLYYLVAIFLSLGIIFFVTHVIKRKE